MVLFKEVFQKCVFAYCYYDWNVLRRLCNDTERHSGDIHDKQGVLGAIVYLFGILYQTLWESGKERSSHSNCTAVKYIYAAGTIKP